MYRDYSNVTSHELRRKEGKIGVMEKHQDGRQHGVREAGLLGRSIQMEHSVARIGWDLVVIS